MNALETIVSIVILIIIGYLTKRIGLLKSDDSLTLNKIVVNIALPALIFSTIYTADLSNVTSLVSITVICLLIGFIGGLIGYTYSKIRKHSKKTRWSITSASAMFNSGFMGYSIILEFLGQMDLLEQFFSTQVPLLYSYFLESSLYCSSEGNILQ